MSHFRRMILALAFVGALTGHANAAQVCYFGECGPVASSPASTTAKAAPAATPLPETSGSWQLFDRNGQRMSIDKFDDGSGLAIGKVKGELTFLLIHPRWSLTQGQTFNVRMNIDGHLFTGAARAMDATTLAIESVSANVVQTMYRGTKATISIADYSWDLDLANASRAIAWAAIAD